MSLYQSPIRKTIQKDIYKKPTFSVNIFGREYFWTIKTKWLFGIQFKRYQILWVDVELDNDAINEAVKSIQEQFWNSWKNLFFQWGVTNEIVKFDIKDHKEPAFAVELRAARCFLRSHFETAYDLIFSFRENMPESGIVYDLTKNNETLLSEMNKASKDRTKKWIKNNIEFRAAEEVDYEEFYQKRQETAGKKWFHTIPKAQYYTLITHLKSHKMGNLFLTKHNWSILSGAICIYDEKSIVCLYSFADRNQSNMWWQQYLKYNIFGRWRDNWFTICDMMWWAPTGFPEHELASVSAFKESMWGIKTEYIGNYDIILNKPMYKLLKWYYQQKK